MQAFCSVFVLFLALLLYHISPCLAILTGYFVREERLIKERLEEILKTDVDVIHGPIQSTDMIEIDKEIEVYAA